MAASKVFSATADTLSMSLKEVILKVSITALPQLGGELSGWYISPLFKKIPPFQERMPFLFSGTTGDSWSTNFRRFLLRGSCICTRLMSQGVNVQLRSSNDCFNIVCGTCTSRDWAIYDRHLAQTFRNLLSIRLNMRKNAFIKHVLFT